MDTLSNEGRGFALYTRLYREMSSFKDIVANTIKVLIICFCSSCGSNCVMSFFLVFIIFVIFLYIGAGNDKNRGRTQSDVVGRTGRDVKLVAKDCGKACFLSVAYVFAVNVRMVCRF